MSHSAQRSCVFETAMGSCAIAWSDFGVTRFLLPTASRAAAEKGLRRRTPDVEPGAPPPEVAEAIALAKRYFSGERTEFSAVPLDIRDQDPFFAQIYDALRQVGWGRTTTYGALAAAVGAPPEAARDVGQAMAKNPMPLLVPCHRVLAAGGKLGGFSAPGGAQTKAKMLRMEGVDLPPPGAPQRSFAF
jgi:methylated-DNA-[protein]-cysteine S-methyltransferase